MIILLARRFQRIFLFVFCFMIISIIVAWNVFWTKAVRLLEDELTESI